jgi:hypothetical protein
MADEYAQEIQKRIDALPPAVRDLVYSADMGTILRSIGAKHQLHVDQIGALETEAAAVMIGLSEAQNFVSEVAENLNVDEQKATAIVNDVNAQLFVKIQDAMKKGSQPSAVSVPVFKTMPPAPAAQAPQTVPAALAPRPVAIQTPSAVPASTTPPPPTTPKPATVVPSAPVATPKSIDMHPADLMLSQKTVTVAPVAPKPAAAPVSTTPATATPATATPQTPPATGAIAAKPEPIAPKPYTADPYREPVE